MNARSAATLLQLGRAVGAWRGGRVERRELAEHAEWIATVPPRRPRKPGPDPAREPRENTLDDVLGDANAELADLPSVALARRMAAHLAELAVLEAIHSTLVALAGKDEVTEADADAALHALWDALRPGFLVREIADVLETLAEGARIDRYPDGARIRFCRCCRTVLAHDGDTCPRCHAPNRRRS